MKKRKTREQVNSDYWRKTGCLARRARRDAEAAPRLRLHLMRAPSLGVWARAVVEHAERALGAKRTLWLIGLRSPAGQRLDELFGPIVEAMAPQSCEALAGPYTWLKNQLIAHGLTQGDYLTLPNC